MAHKKTIDQFIQWIERCLFHEVIYSPPTERDMNIWLKQAKKFKREQTNLKSKLDALEGIENPTCHSGHNDYPLTLWDCPVCVQIEKEKLEFDLSKPPQERLYCRGCSLL